MTKRFLILTLALVLLLGLFTACADTTEDGEESSDTETVEESISETESESGTTEDNKPEGENNNKPSGGNNTPGGSTPDSGEDASKETDYPYDGDVDLPWLPI